MKIITTILSILLTAQLASAGCVMCFGDSITAMRADRKNDWCNLMNGPNPNMVVYNAGRNGRTTQEGIAEIDAAFVSATAKCGPVSHVAVLLGVNDFFWIGDGAVNTVARLNTIGDAIVAHGAVPLIFTLTPSQGQYEVANDFTRDVSNELYSSGTHQVGDVRDEFTRGGWNGCATDGLHPSTLSCRQVIADFGASMYPW